MTWQIHNKAFETSCEKKKMLIKSIFFFIHNVFYSVKERNIKTWEGTVATHKPFSGSFNSAANKVMMSKILTNGDLIF